MTMAKALCRTVIVLAIIAVAFAGEAIRPAAKRMLRFIDSRSAEPPPPIHSALWSSRTEQFQVLDQHATGPSIVYLGDSITAWVNLEEYVCFESGRVLNRAIAGDTTQGVLKRVQTTFPRDVEVCFLLIGYNDLSRGRAPEDVAGAILSIRDYLLDTHGVSHVVVESLLPAATQVAPSIDLVNEYLRQDNRRGASFLDLYPEFLKDGSSDLECYADAVHLSGTGIVRRIQHEVEHLRFHCPLVGPNIGLVLDKEK